jgi:hypothetical protein
MALQVDANLTVNVLFHPLSKLCLLFSIIGKLHHAVMDFGVALSQHVGTLSGGTEAFAKASTEMLFQFFLLVPLTLPADNMPWNCVVVIGLQMGTRWLLQAVRKQSL